MNNHPAHFPVDRIHSMLRANCFTGLRALCTIAGLALIPIAGYTEETSPLTSAATPYPTIAYCNDLYKGVYPTPSSVTPTPPQNDFGGSKYAESMWASTGTRWPLKPLFNSPAAPVFGLHPNYNSKNPGNSNKNDFAAEVIQALYNKNLWEEGEQSSDFANRAIHLAGATHAAIGDLDSGLGKTRKSDSFDLERKDQKYVIGTVALSSHLRGKPAFVDIGKEGILGDMAHNNPFSGCTWASLGLNFADMSGNFDISFEENHSEEEYAQYHIWELIGFKNVAMIGRSIAPAVAGPFDARLQARKEDDSFDIQPAVVRQLIGAEMSAYIDNKYAYKYENNAWGQSGNLDGGAYAIFSRIFSPAKESWVNVNKVRHVQVNFVIDEHYSSCDGTQNSQRSGSQIGSYTGVEITRPILTAAPPGLISKTIGILLGSKEYMPLMGDAKIAFPELTEEQTPNIPGKKVAIMATEDVIVGGDDTPDYRTSGFKASVLEVNGAIRLAPRTAPPAISSKVAPPDRAGLLYFDAARNALRVSAAALPSSSSSSDASSASSLSSVASSSTSASSSSSSVASSSTSDWHKAEVVWVEAAIAEEELDPSRDAAGGSNRKGAAAPLAQAPREEAFAAMERAKQQAITGESPYLPPRARVIPPADSLRAAEKGFKTTFLTSGFEGQPRIFWRRACGLPKQPEYTPWREVEPERVESAAGIPESGAALSSVIDYSAKDSLGMAPQPGQNVDFLLVDQVTFQTAGTGFAITGTQ